MARAVRIASSHVKVRLTVTDRENDPKLSERNTRPARNLRPRCQDGSVAPTSPHPKAHLKVPLVDKFVITCEPGETCTETERKSQLEKSRLLP